MEQVEVEKEVPSLYSPDSIRIFPSWITVHRETESFIYILKKRRRSKLEDSPLARASSLLFSLFEKDIGFSSFSLLLVCAIYRTRIHLPTPPPTYHLSWLKSSGCIEFGFVPIFFSFVFFFSFFGLILICKVSFHLHRLIEFDLLSCLTTNFFSPSCKFIRTITFHKKIDFPRPL